MDSGEDARTATATASLPPEPAAIQESAILNFMSNLSPIKPERTGPGPPGFPELNSPLNIFTSPHLNPLQETTHLRSQEFCQRGVSGNRIPRASEESEKSRIQSSNQSLQVWPASSSGCVDGYFANDVAVDCANSADSADSSLIRCIDMLESLKDCTEATAIICKLDNKIDSEEARGAPTTREVVEQELQGSSSSDYKIAETDTKQRSNEMPTSVYRGEKLNLSVDLPFQEQCLEISVAKNAGVTHKDDLGCSKFPPQALEPIQGYEDDVQNYRRVSKESIENMILHNFEGQQHCVMQRQYLPFDEAQGNVVAKNHGYDLSSMEAREAGSGTDTNTNNFTQPTTSMASYRNIEISKSTVSKRSDIGSHLNTIMPIGCGATGNAISGDKGCLKIPTRLVSTMGCHQPENTGNIPILLDNRGKFLASSEAGIHEDPASGLMNTLAPQPSQIVKASNDPRFLELGEYQRTQGDRRESMNEHAGAVEESDLSGPIKKRKQASGMSDDDIWKRCNCKKTKCLKLYCDCFAAGIYCSGSCTCRECFNNIDYEDTVLDTRQQIESRNPLAFSPKIEDVNNSTPSLARHKRGCNCRRSTCVKKYCECYQANVGCSDGCRCEGCKNPYGIREEYGMAKNVPKEGSFPEKSETQLNEKMEIAAGASGHDSMLACDLFNRHNLTHLTPAFQAYDNLMKDIPESRFSNTSRLPSPQPNLPSVPSGRSPILPPKPDNDDILLLEARRGFQDSVQGLNYSNIETAMDKFSSPRYDLTTLPNHPSSPAMAFPDSSKLVDREATIATARSQLYPGSSHLQSGTSLYWQKPPTPAPPAAAHFGERKITQAVDLTAHDTSTPSDEVKAESPSGSRFPDSPA